MSEVITKQTENETNIKEFDAQQKEQLAKVFQSFFDKTTRISTIAKVTKLAIIGGSYNQHHELDGIEIETLLETIMELNDFIHSECFEYAFNPNLVCESN